MTKTQSNGNTIVYILSAKQGRKSKYKFKMIRYRENSEKSKYLVASQNLHLSLKTVRKLIVTSCKALSNTIRTLELALCYNFIQQHNMPPPHCQGPWMSIKWKLLWTRYVGW